MLQTRDAGKAELTQAEPAPPSRKTYSMFNKKHSMGSHRASLSSPDRRYESWREVSQIPEIFESLGVKPLPPNTRAWRKTHLCLADSSGDEEEDEEEHLRSALGAQPAKPAKPMSKMMASVFDPKLPIDLSIKGQGAKGETWPRRAAEESELRQPSYSRAIAKMGLSRGKPSLIRTGFPPVHVRDQPNLPPGAFRRRVGQTRCFGFDRENREHLDVVHRVGLLRRGPNPPADARKVKKLTAVRLPTNNHSSN